MVKIGFDSGLNPDETIEPRNSRKSTLNQNILKGPMGIRSDFNIVVSQLLQDRKAIKAREDGSFLVQRFLEHARTRMAIPTDAFRTLPDIEVVVQEINPAVRFEDRTDSSGHLRRYGILPKADGESPS